MRFYVIDIDIFDKPLILTFLAHALDWLSQDILKAKKVNTLKNWKHT